MANEDKKVLCKHCDQPEDRHTPLDQPGDSPDDCGNYEPATE